MGMFLEWSSGCSTNSTIAACTLLWGKNKDDFAGSAAADHRLPATSIHLPGSDVIMFGVRYHYFPFRLAARKRRLGGGPRRRERRLRGKFPARMRPGNTLGTTQRDDWWGIISHWGCRHQQQKHEWGGGGWDGMGEYYTMYSYKTRVCGQ